MGKRSDPSKVFIVATFLVAACLLIYGWGQSREISEGNVNEWLKQLPTGATSSQVRAFFISKNIRFNREEPLDGKGPLIIGDVDTSGDLAIEVYVEMDTHDHMIDAFAKGGYR